MDEMYTPAAGQSTRDFPIQQPTAADLLVWKKAIGSLTRTGNKLLTSLGTYLSQPHKPDEWYINNRETDIYHLTPTGLYEHYVLNRTRRLTRYGAKFTLYKIKC